MDQDKKRKIEQNLKNEIHHEETREKAPYELDTGTLSDIATRGGSREPLGPSLSPDEESSRAPSLSPSLSDDELTDEDEFQKSA